jgi:hypothetical protein
LALPGSGTGFQNGTGTLPGFVSWPQTLYPDGLFGAGSDGVVSWGIAHHTDQCALLKVIGADPSDSGTSECLPSWYRLSTNGGLPAIGGVYGQQNATVFVVLPEGTNVEAAPSSADCFTWSIESNFASTKFCEVRVTAGDSERLTFDNNGDALGGPYRIDAVPGRISVYAPTPTPSP